MSGRGIGELGNPLVFCRVDRGTASVRCGFETIDQSRYEDMTRYVRIRRYFGKRPNDPEAQPALALADKLHLSAYGGEVEESLASHVSMRGLRIKVAGALWQLIMECGQ